MADISTTTEAPSVPLLGHKLRNVMQSLKRGDLESSPHFRPAIVMELREVAHHLQATAVEVMRHARNLNDAGTVLEVRKIGDDAAEAISQVLGSLRGK